MIPLVPYRRFQIDLPIEPRAVLDGVAQRIHPRRTDWKPSAPRLDGYEGELTSDGFRLNRVIRGRNSFLPFARGRVTGTARGSSVVVTLTLHPATIAFLVAWCLVFGAISFSILTAWQSGIATPPPFPLAGIPFAYVLTTLAFGFEAVRVERFIRDVLSTTGSPN